MLFFLLFFIENVTGRCIIYNIVNYVTILDLKMMSLKNGGKQLGPRPFQHHSEMA